MPSDSSEQPGMVAPGMLPRDGGITTAPDATQALVRAISRYEAIQAAKITETRQSGVAIPGVEAFREEALVGRLLAADQVGGWIHEQEQRDGEPSLWLEGVSLNAGDYEQADTGGIRITKPIELDLRSGGGTGTAWEHPGAGRRELLYTTPELAVTGCPVRDGGTLDQLRRLSLLLAEEYLWTPEQGATFTLTGLIPYSAGWEPRLADVRVRGRRPREMSVKHLELACFTAEYEGRSIAQRFALWNALHPEWSYRASTTFGWDAREAVRHLNDRMGAEGPAAEPDSGPDTEDVLRVFAQISGKPKRALWGAEVEAMVKDLDAAEGTPERTKKRPAQGRPTPTDLKRADDSASDEIARQLLAVMQRMLDTKDEREFQQAMAEGKRLNAALNRLLYPEGAEVEA